MSLETPATCRSLETPAGVVILQKHPLGVAGLSRILCEMVIYYRNISLGIAGVSKLLQLQESCEFLDFPEIPKLQNSEKNNSDISKLHNLQT